MTNEIITAADIYWLTRLDGLKSIATVTCVAFGVASVFLLVAGIDCRNATRTSYGELPWKQVPDEVARVKSKLMLRLLRWTAPAFLVAVAAAVMIPTTKEAVAILVIPKVANSEGVQGLGSDLVGLAREWMEELRPAKEATK